MKFRFIILFFLFNFSLQANYNDIDYYINNNMYVFKDYSNANPNLEEIQIKKHNISKKIKNTILKYSNLYFKSDKKIPYLILSHISVESNFKENAIGDNGNSFGCMQVQLKTALYLIEKDKKLFKKYKKFLKKPELLKDYLLTYEGSIEFGVFYLFYKSSYISSNSNVYLNYFKMVSLYNGGFRNHVYVDKVFKIFTSFI
jgi:hypothetical protein